VRHGNVPAEDESRSGERSKWVRSRDKPAFLRRCPNIGDRIKLPTSGLKRSLEEPITLAKQKRIMDALPARGIPRGTHHE
jgi:hypothetical protein